MSCLRSLSLLFLTMIILMAACAANAQNAQGGILGHVGDSSGASLAGAKVTLLSTDTSVTRTYTTTGAGDYHHHIARSSMGNP